MCRRLRTGLRRILGVHEAMEVVRDAVPLIETQTSCRPNHPSLAQLLLLALSSLRARLADAPMETAAENAHGAVAFSTAVATSGHAVISMALRFAGPSVLEGADDLRLRRPRALVRGFLGQVGENMRESMNSRNIEGRCVGDFTMFSSAVYQ